MSAVKLFLILFFSFIANFSLSNPIKSSNNNSKDNNKINRVVALTSLSADLVNNISHESLLGIPGSSLLKNNNDFSNKTVISSGRTPPNLEKIINLKPELVIGSKGFHNKTLKSLEKLGVKTLSVRIANFNDLEKLSSDIQILLDKKVKLDLENVIPNCYNLDKDIKTNKGKELLVLVSSKPILSPNSKSWAGNLINRFGYINLTSELDSKSQFKGYVNLSPEWLLSSKPSNLIIINTPGSDDSQYKQMSIWNDLPAVTNKKVFSFDYYGLINAGSLNSINKACQKLSSI
jgi:iron complex transport system substrate-binding protein